MKNTFALIAAAAMVVSMPALANEGSVESKAQHYFQKMDTNADGSVTDDEHEAFSDNMFDQADSNNDDQLSLAELTAAKKAEKAEHKATKGETNQ